MAKPVPKIAGKHAIVAPDTIHPDPKNPNRQSKFIYGKLLESIRRFGFTDPVIVRDDPAGGKMIIGGEHRWKAATQLKMEKIPIVDLGAVTDAEAHLLMVVLNETKGAPDDDLLAGLIQEIHVEIGSEGLHVLPYTDARLADLLDDVPPPPVDDEPDTSTSSLKATDLCAILEMKGITQPELARFLETMRKWSAAREDQSRPAWMDLRRHMDTIASDRRGDE